MSSITTIASGDLISTSRTDINTNFSNLNTDKIETSTLDTDTTLAANSDSKIATQKAVKAYVDSGGNVNASETAKGIVEEATDAEVTAGTATGLTGAKLFITPAKLATASGETGVSKLVKTKSTGLLDSSIYVSSFPAQTLPLLTGTNVPLTSQMTSDPTGTVIFVGYNTTATVWTIDRFLKDTNTSNYYKTHTANLTISLTEESGMAVVGTYLYTINVVGGVQTLSRYLAADLTGVTTMTISGTKTYGAMWSDGTDLYISDAGATTNWTRYTISGTTATNAGSVSFTSSEAGSKGCISNGTHVWIGNARTGTLSIRKYAVAGGAVVSTTTVILNTNSFLNGGTTHLPICLFMGNSSMLGLGFVYNTCSASAVTGTIGNIFAITLP